MYSVSDVYNQEKHWEDNLSEHRKSQRLYFWKVGIATFALAAASYGIDMAARSINEELKSPQERQDEAYMRRYSPWFQREYKLSEDAYLAGKKAMGEQDTRTARKDFLLAKAIVERRKKGCPATQTDIAEACRADNNMYLAWIDRRLREVENSR